jgi:hypothetical protein
MSLIRYREFNVVFLCHFFKLFFNFNYILQHYVFLGLNFIICFNLLSIKLFRSHDSGCRFGRLTQVDSNNFFGLFLIDFFLISSINIGFIKN